MNKIREFREKQNMTQQELSEKSGISRAYISQLENNDSLIVKSSTMLAIASALKKPVGSIFLNKMETICNTLVFTSIKHKRILTDI